MISLLLIIIEFFVVKKVIFKFICLGLFILSLGTGLLTYFINPGTFFKENNEEGKNYYCSLCKFNYPKSNKKYSHCFLCQICIQDPDHHCGIFEKCIGRKNLICFYLFPTVSIFLLIVFLISTFYHFVKEKK